MIIARSSAGHRHGFEETLKRLKAFRDAGADMLWPSTWHKQDLDRCKQAFPDVPLCVSLTPFSQKGYAGLTVRDAADMGYQMIFFSSTVFFKAVKAGLEAATKPVQYRRPKTALARGVLGKGVSRSGRLAEVDRAQRIEVSQGFRLDLSY